MQVIIEGSDLVGKTTLARALVRDKTTPFAGVLNLSRLPPDWRSEEYDALLNPRIILDRWIYSAWAYDDTLRANNRDVSLKEIRRLHHRYENSTFRVGVIASEALIQCRFEERGDDMYALSQILQVNEWFIEHIELFDLVLSASVISPHVTQHTTLLLNSYEHKKAIYGD